VVPEFEKPEGRAQCKQLLVLVSFGQLSRGFSQAGYCSSFLKEIFDILVAIVV
jgi:hypothetical protein